MERIPTEEFKVNKTTNSGQIISVEVITFLNFFLILQIYDEK